MKKNRWISLSGLALVIFSSALAFGDSNWTGAQDSDFSNTNNWDNGVPTATSDTGFFNAAANSNVSLSAATSISGLTFTSAAPSYTVNVNGSGVLSLNGSGLLNNSANAQSIQNQGVINLNNSAAATNVLIYNQSGGTLNFNDNSTLGSGTSILNNVGGVTTFASSVLGAPVVNGASIENAGGSTSFESNTSAGTAQITNATGATNFYSNSTASGASINLEGGFLGFQNDSTAGASTITVTGSIFGGADLTFYDNATAGNATIENTGTITFLSSATAATSNITTNTGNIYFEDGATASSATITGTGGYITFADSATAEDSVINNQASTIYFDGTATASSATISNTTNGLTEFYSSSTADVAHISNNGGATVFLFNSSASSATISCANQGQIAFDETSTAGNALLTTNSQGKIDFILNATAGNATIMNNAGGFTDFTYVTTAGSATITNVSGGSTVFEASSTAGGAQMTNDGGLSKFVDNASAGVSTITAINNGQTAFVDSAGAGNANLVAMNGGQISFSTSSSAGYSTILNTQGGFTEFNDLSTASSATITNNNNGATQFNNNSNAGQALINVSNGVVQFNDVASAAGSTITVTAVGATAAFASTSTAGGSVINDSGGSSTFYDDSTAGNATINNNAGGAAHFSDFANAGTAQITNSGGSSYFYDSSSASSATIINSDGSTYFNNTSNAGQALINVSSGVLQFNNSASAEGSTITVTLGGTAAFANNSTAGESVINNNGGSSTFYDLSTASNSIITNTSGGSVNFSTSSTAGDATITNNSGGSANFSSQAGANIAHINNNVGGISNFYDSTNAGGSQIANAGGVSNFYDISSASNSVITNTVNGGVNFNSANAGNATINNSTGGFTKFNGTSNADNAQITNSDNNGTIQFNNSSNAGSSVLVNNGGLIQFLNTSHGGTSSIENNSGLFDMSNLQLLGLTVGSIAGGGEFQLGGNTLTTGVNNTDTEVSGTIGGTGSLVKVGTGTLTLSGMNGYSGGTTVNGGILNISDDDNLGAASGTLTLDSGTLQTENGLTSSRTIVLGSDGGSIDTNNFNSNLSGTIEGSGTLFKVGAGTLTVSGSNSYGGGTIINGGILRIGGNNVLPSSGSVVLANVAGAGLDLNGYNQTIGLLSGGGDVGGDVLLGSGTLTTGSDGSSGIYSGVISGSGSLVKIGSGTLMLSGGNVFTGSATVTGGDLELTGDNSLRGDAIIVAGATFSYGGTMGGINNHGTVIPGVGGIGKLTVSDYSGPGTLHIVFNGANTNFMQVNGLATLTGGILDLTGNDFSTGRFTVITASSIVGSFATVDAPEPSYFLHVGAVYTSSDVDVVVNSLSFSDVAQSGNQQSLAATLDADSQSTEGSSLRIAIPGLNAAPTTGAGSFNAMLDAIHSLTTEAQIHDAYDQISGDSLASFQATGLRTAEVFSDQMRNRMVSDDEVTTTALLPPTAVLPYENLEQPAFAPAVSSETVTPNTSGLWSRGIGFSNQVNGDTSIGSPSSRSTTGGFQGGYDFEAAENVIVGISGGFAQTSLNVDDRDSSGNSTSIQSGIYASYTPGPWFVNGSMAYVTSANDMTRNVEFTGINEQASSNFNSQVETLLVEAGYNLAPRKSFSLQPLVSLRQSHLHQDAFTETGAPGVDLSVQDQSVNSLMSAMGARLSRQFMVNTPHEFSLGARAAWQHELADVDNSITAEFADAPVSAFSVQATPRSRNAAAIGLDGHVNLSKNLEGFGDYSATLGSNQNTQGLFGGLRLSW